MYKYKEPWLLLVLAGLWGLLLRMLLPDPAGLSDLPLPLLPSLLPDPADLSDLPLPLLLPDPADLSDLPLPSLLPDPLAPGGQWVPSPRSLPLRQQAPVGLPDLAGLEDLLDLPLRTLPVRWALRVPGGPSLPQGPALP